jgi:hypothetical protein
MIKSRRKRIKRHKEINPQKYKLMIADKFAYSDRREFNPASNNSAIINHASCFAIKLFNHTINSTVNLQKSSKKAIKL